MMRDKKTVTLTAVRSISGESERRQRDLLMPFLSSLLILLGIWMAVSEAFSGMDLSLFALMIPAVIGLAAALLYRPTRAFRIAAIVFCIAAAMVIIIWNARFRAGAAACFGMLSEILTGKTGYLYFGYAETGDPTLFLMIASVFSGVACGMYVRLKNMLFGVAGPLLFAAVCIFGIAKPGLWLALGLAGSLLFLMNGAAGGKCRLLSVLPLALTAAAVWIVFLIVPLSFDGISDRARTALHEIRYEKNDNPMPEGNLKNLKPYDPGNGAALDVTMDHWEALYLRGFTGAAYADNEWKPLDEETVREKAPLLYNLQKSYFYPGSQLAAANQVLGEEADNRITVAPAGACAAYQYIPYGASGITTLDPRELASEGTAAGTGYTASLYPVEDAYLVQMALAGKKEQAENYADGEEAYRDFVYENYTAIPDTVYAQLAEHFPLDGASLTTMEAGLAIREWIDSAMTYDDYAISGSGDFFHYLLDFDGRGYSVHYATLATLLMRACGIPARYVEGYVVASEEAAELDDGSTLRLTEKNSHAWTEYYLDGVGWLPFDAAPDFADEIVFRLPEDGSAGEDGEGRTQTGPVAKLPQRSVRIDTSEKIDEDNGPQYVFYVLFAVLLFALILTLALLAQSLLLRSRLRQRVRKFRTLPPGAGSADCFRYIGTVLRLCGVPKDNLPATKRAEVLAEALGLEKNQVEEAVWLATEVWYSGHEISEEQRRKALACLSHVLNVWKKKTRGFRRFKDRWIRCRVL